ncbi:tripartite ATP-independent transporter DctP family solute receptor [Herbaspirillum sp. 1173]|uniref:TRAP transporter substrate-binding protein n=1 Tax=Herbaspirillum sp. 1173 TaxID=2817734 RepID=UPI000EAE5D20|nr:TRAP transporter substrate-binding protein [Herbaspirillum sp. 1173]MDR6742053.1 tripartite ATP-independent transporter DctP family solute receptor [Herbaspirillum sp. 1173]
MKDEIASKKMSRRQILKAGAVGAALPLFSILTRPANAAEFTYKFATGQDPSHPVNKRAQEAIDRIRNATNGRMEIKLFPANQLGSDTDLMSQIRNGGVEFFNQANTVLSTLVPAAGIVNTGFAFQDYAAVWKAMDGPLGAHVRAQIEKVGLLTMSKPWDNGFRQITTSTKAIRSAADVKGLKLRVPAAPMLTSLFSALGASPTPINFNEVYSSLQTKLVEGQENPLAIISTARLYEVQKFCTLSNHVWDAYWILGNRRAFDKLPKDIQEIVRRELDQAATDERADIASFSGMARNDLAGKGLQIVDADKESFKQALAQANFYKDMRARFGEEAWKLLESSVGTLG